MFKVTIYTDGAAKGNPGKGGYGAVLLYKDSNDKLHTKEICGGYKLTTNNRMELMGVIKAIENLVNPCEIDLYSDSKYVVNAFNNNWITNWQNNNWKTSTGKDVKNPDLWKYLLKILKPHKITFHWVKGHNDNLYNEKCDKLASDSAANNAILEDIKLE